MAKQLSLKEAREQGRMREFIRQQSKRKPEAPNSRERFWRVLRAMAKGDPPRSSEGGEGT